MIGFLILAALAEPAAAEPEEAPRPTVEERIEVVGLTPLAASGLERARVAAGVQSASAEELAAADRLDLADFLDRRFSGVAVNHVQNNPFQPDLRYRGYTASPLLGSPQGLAVYQDGVRLNEPFGDTVNWDLVPQAAIAAVELVPGSSPLFGLNALGGALALRMKSGRSHPGSRLELAGGSFGRRSFEVEAGGGGERLDYYLAGHAFEGDGWRDVSPSAVRQLYGRVGWRRPKGSAELVLTAARNELHGNGALPAQLLATRRDAVFTHPDVTENRLFFPALELRYELTPRWLVEAVVHLRRNDVETLNGDEREDDEDGDDDDGGDDDFDAVRNTSRTRGRTHGAAVESSLAVDVAGRPGRLLAGAAWEAGRADFRSAAELARLTPDRGTDGSGLFDPDAFVDLETRVRNLGLYTTAVLPLGPRVDLQLATRYHRSRVTLRDRLGDDLDGDHEFERWSPGVGLTWALGPRASVYASWNASSRAPTPVELTCADPEDPCRLPNAFVADPPLEQVVTRTLEAGVRGGGEALRLRLSLFRATSDDDLVFISSGALRNAGHFDNVGVTRRQGLELGLEGRPGKGLGWYLGYAYVEATFESAFAVPSPNHPLARGGEIAVRPGDRLPGVPRHGLKAGGNLDLGPDLTLGASLIAASSHPLRGDEANLLDPVDGYLVVDLNARYRLSPRLALALAVSNLLDEDYETFGLLGDAADVLGDDFDDPRFLGPAPPRAVRLALELRLGS